MAKSMEKEFIIIAQEENIKANGFTIKNMDMVSYNMSMETNTKVIGKTAKDLDKEFMNIQMEISIRDNGFLI